MVESHLGVGGAVTFWSLADANDLARLSRGFARLGLEPFVPDPRPAPAVGGRHARPGGREAPGPAVSYRGSTVPDHARPRPRPATSRKTELP